MSFANLNEPLALASKRPSTLTEFLVFVEPRLPAGGWAGEGAHPFGHHVGVKSGALEVTRQARGGGPGRAAAAAPPLRGVFCQLRLIVDLCPHRRGGGLVVEASLPQLGNQAPGA